MAVTVIPLVGAGICEIRKMLEDPSYADSIFVFPDTDCLSGVTLRAYPLRCVGLQSLDESGTHEAVTEIDFLRNRHGYTRIFFVAIHCYDETPVFSCSASHSVRRLIADKLYNLATSGLHYMNPALRGTYGYTDQTLTAVEINQRMRIIDGDSWTDIPE